MKRGQLSELRLRILDQMSLVSYAIESLGALTAWIDPQQTRSGRKKVSLASEYSISPAWRSLIGARARFFLTNFTLCLVMVVCVSKATECLFTGTTAFDVFAQHLVMSLYWFLIRSALPPWARWWDFVACGMIPEEHLKAGYFAWDCLDGKRPEKLAPAALLDKVYKTFVGGEYITIEHIGNGAMMAFGLVTGSATWFRHGIISVAGAYTSELLMQYQVVVAEAIWGFQEGTDKWGRKKTRKLPVPGPDSSGRLTRAMRTAWNLTGRFVWKNILCNSHHGAIWVAFIPLCVYCADIFPVVLGCAVLAFNPEHFLGHLLYPLRFTSLHIHNGEWCYNPKARGALEIWVAWVAWKNFFIIAWRVGLFQFPLAYWLVNEAWSGNFSWMLLVLTLGYCSMTRFNIQCLIPIPYVPWSGHWTLRMLVTRLGKLRGSVPTVNPCFGGLAALHISELPLRKHLAEDIREEARLVQAAGWRDDTLLGSRPSRAQLRRSRSVVG